jgi:pimeloyl-ACP methyl ester carboxylesterase
MEADLHIEGEGAETIVMVHGWPDTYRLWDRQVEALKGRFRCVRFTLPGFDGAGPRKAYEFEELIGLLKDLIERTCPGKKVILMLHDWGCFFGYQFYVRNPQLVSRIVGVDIGDPRSTRTILSRRELRLIATYQIWLALAWAVGGPIGDWMARFMARQLRCPSDLSRVSARMGYPYFMLWFGGRRSYRRQVRRFVPECPMLFVYGRRKRVRFHSPAWAEELAAREGNQVVEFDTGHWVMSEQPDLFNRVVSGWLSGPGGLG